MIVTAAGCKQMGAAAGPPPTLPSGWTKITKTVTLQTLASKDAKTVKVSIGLAHGWEEQKEMESSLQPLIIAKIPIIHREINLSFSDKELRLDYQDIELSKMKSMMKHYNPWWHVSEPRAVHLSCGEGLVQTYDMGLTEDNKLADVDYADYFVDAGNVIVTVESQVDKNLGLDKEADAMVKTLYIK
jgi:hypothetical protein